MEHQQEMGMISRAFIIAGIIGCGASTLSTAKESPGKIWRNTVKDARALLSRGVMEEVDHVLESGTLDEKIAIRVAFWKLSPSDYKSEILLRFLREPDRFWIVKDYYSSTRLEIGVADSLSMDTISYAKTQFGIELAGTGLLFSVEGRAIFEQMIRAKLAKEPLPAGAEPSTPLSEAPPQQHAPDPDSQSEAIPDAPAGANRFYLLLLGAGSLTVAIALAIRRRRSKRA